ncbi:MAG: PBECR2 nuclease fold domain-containing protein [Halomonas sp.]|nr:PBECR2 nuclease fold domain-containing protein [Halomonas sp.]
MVAARYGSLPFREQIRAFRERVPIATRAWDDVYGRENDQAFAVAGSTRQAIVEDFADAVGRAIEGGRTLEDFRRDFDEIVARHGWAYNGSRGWRSRVIYDTNLRQSYAAGREAQMADPELRRARPYGLYRHGGSKNPRPHHIDKDGWVVPIDDPWWDTWTPQNGWGCSCKKFMLSQADVDRLGLAVKEAPQIERETRVVGANGPNPRTVEVPVGIDPGFEHRPGMARLRGITPRPLGEPLPAPRTAPARSAPDLPPPPRPAPEPPAADGPEAEVGAFLARFGVDEADGVAFHRDALGEILPLSRQLFVDEAGELALGQLTGNLTLLAETLDAPDEIWTALVHDEAAGRWRLRRRYLAWFQGGAVMMEWGRAGWAAWVGSPDNAQIDEWRRGVRLYRRGEEEN